MLSISASTNIGNMPKNFGIVIVMQAIHLNKTIKKKEFGNKKR